jgi:hypothetical protein
MITLQASKSSIDNIYKEIELKLDGVKELKSPAVLEELSNPKKYHHIYEWKKIGITDSKLFFLYKEPGVGGSLIIKPGFKQSYSTVPIDPNLLVPGRTGKTVAARTIFRDKASVMESGSPIIYKASKPLPIMDDGQLRFIAAGTYIKNLKPGGTQVKGSFEKFFNMWFDTKLSSVISSSGILDNINLELEKVLNKKGAGPVQVRTAIINLLKQYYRGESIA